MSFSDRFCGLVISNSVFRDLCFATPGIVNADPGVLFDAGDLGFDPAVQPDGDRPAHTPLLRAADIAYDQNPESALTTIRPLAPARRVRPIVSFAKWTTPRCDPPSRRRAPTTSPVSAPNANRG